MFEAICNHLKYVTNKGNIRSAITIFKQRTEKGHDFRWILIIYYFIQPKFYFIVLLCLNRVWNSQFISYAGYKVDDKIVGDPSQLEITQVIFY